MATAMAGSKKSNPSEVTKSAKDDGSNDFAQLATKSTAPRITQPTVAAIRRQAVGSAGSDDGASAFEEVGGLVAGFWI